MNSLPAYIGLVIGVTAAIQVAYRTLDRVRKARATVIKRDERIARASIALRESARLSLAMRREHRELEGDVDKMQRRTAARVERISELEETTIRTYVLDDRKAPGDFTFLTTITHPAFDKLAPGAPADLIASWREGRRYLLWASDMERATSRAALRCPPSKGYVVAPLELYQGTSDIPG